MANRRQSIEVQSLLLSRGRFRSAAQAKRWASQEGFKAPAVDKTPEYYRLRQHAPGLYKKGSFRTIDLTHGVKAVIGKRKNLGLAETNSGHERIPDSKPGDGLRAPEPVTQVPGIIENRPASSRSSSSTTRPRLVKTKRGGPRVRYTSHKNGMKHIRSTIRKMADLIQKGSTDYEIRGLAVRITHHVPSKQPTLEMAALYKWVRDNIRYRFDPVSMEWLQSPNRTLRERAGDCDDIAVLLGALAESIGYKTRLLTVGPEKERPKHIAIQVRIPPHWITLDPVLEPPGKSTRPSDRPGRFGATATGIQRIWNSKTGEEMRKANCVLGGTFGEPIDIEETSLWPDPPFFRQVPSRPVVPYPNAPLPPRVYESADSPGFRTRQARDKALAGD